MKKMILALIISLTAITTARANLVYQGSYNPGQPMEEYFQAAYPDYDKSVIFVFFNNNPCPECAQAVNLIAQTYKENLSEKYSLFIINYQNDNEYDFIENYNLSQPLEVVLQRVDDGQALGWKKLDNLQNQVSDPVSFSDSLIFQIDSYLGNS